MYRILKNIVDGSVERTLPRTESRGVTELEHMPFHRGNQGILVRTCRQAGHGIKTVHPEQVPDHRVRRGTKPGIPDRSLVIYSLYRSDGRGGDTLAGEAPVGMTGIGGRVRQIPGVNEPGTSRTD
jgi:hypothetical protein